MTAVPKLAAMILAALLASLAGFIGSRVVVAEADAHRMDLPDRWWDPVCETCGSSLGITVLRCTTDRHLQRGLVAAVVVGATIGSGALPLVVPTLWVVPAYVAFVLGTILLTVTDLDTKLIPNRILVRVLVIGGFLLVVGGLASSNPGAVARAVGGGFAYFGIMFVLALIARGSLGFGDVKLAALLGVFTGYLGWAQLTIAVLGAFLIGGVVSLALLVSGRAGRKDAIPFGPFMVAGAFVAVYAGDQIIRWYNG